jgi:F-type H+-transporting ATPase subunit b
MKLIAKFTTAAVMFTAAPVWAAEKASLPQMDPTWFPNQLAWLAICFVVLYLLVSKFVAPSVGNVLAAREATIAEAIAKAEAYKQHAEQTRGDFETGSKNARAEAAELIAKVKLDATQAQADALAKLPATLEQEATKADAALSAALTAAKGDMEKA